MVIRKKVGTGFFFIILKCIIVEEIYQAVHGSCIQYPGLLPGEGIVEANVRALELLIHEDWEDILKILYQYDKIIYKKGVIL